MYFALARRSSAEPPTSRVEYLMFVLSFRTSITPATSMQPVPTSMVEKPQPKIVPRFKIMAPAWWREEHPDDMFGAHPEANFKYYHAVESFCSPLWRREAAERLRALIGHVEAKYGANIVGYHPCPSHEEEWFWPGAIGLPDRSGYGPREVAAWRQWLKRKYGTDNALQKAWAQPAVTLETAEVPPPKRYAECDADGLFLSTTTSRDIIDHNEFLSDMMSDVLLEFAHTVREMCGKKRLFLAFYGYCLETAPSYHQPGVADLLLGAVGRRRRARHEHGRKRCEGWQTVDHGG